MNIRSPCFPQGHRVGFIKGDKTSGCFIHFNSTITPFIKSENLSSSKVKSLS